MQGNPPRAVGARRANRRNRFRGREFAFATGDPREPVAWNTDAREFCLLQELPEDYACSLAGQTSISHRRLRPRSRCCAEGVMYDDLRRDYVAMANDLRHPTSF